MKRMLLPACLLAAGLHAHAQIQNAGFEDWNKLILFDHPVTGLEAQSSNYESWFDDGSISVSEIEAPQGSAMRVENRAVSEVVQPGYFIFGGLPVGVGGQGPVHFPGGFSINPEGITGIEADLRFELSQGSGFILVQFKNGEEPVGAGNYATGTYLFPITGSQNWGHNSFSFDEPVHPSATNCVIAIASGDLINGDGPYAPGQFIEVDNLTLSGSAAAIPGSDFEAWAPVTPIFYPAHCHVNFHPYEQDFLESTQSFAGQAALQLTTLERNGEAAPGLLTMGQVDEGVITPTIPLEATNDALLFRYAYSAQNDLAAVQLHFFVQESGAFMPVHSMTVELEPTLGYSLMHIPFAQQLADLSIEADYMAITFKSSSAQEQQPQVGSTLLVDEVQLSVVSGIFAAFKNPRQVLTTAYPNPTIGRVTIDFHVARTGYYRVYNGSGAQIDIVEFSNQRQITYNLAGQPAGKYVFQFFHAGGTEHVRVIKL